MELRHLRYFIAVVEQQSFTQAAKLLNIAQPPLSRQIQNLEAELGFELFERSSRPLKTTQAGDFFYQQALKLISNAEEMKCTAQRLASQKQTLKLGFSNSLLYGLLSRIIYLFKQKYPLIDIELIEIDSISQMQALKEARLDASFGRMKFNDPLIRHILLRQEALIAGLHAGHTLAAAAEGIYLQDLSAESFFLHPSQMQGDSNILQQLNLNQNQPQKIYPIADLHMALLKSASGEGICLVPESAQQIQMPNLRYLRILDQNAGSTIYLNIRENDDNHAIRLLCDSIYQVYDLEAITYERAAF